VFTKYIFVLFLFLSACSSNNFEQSSCNALEGAIGSSDPISAAVKGAVNAISKAPEYDCVKRDKNMCIDSEGKVKDKCISKK
jgi:thioredoxin-related protein